MKAIEPDMEEFILRDIKPRCNVGLVGGSDLKKILIQMGGEIGKYLIIDKCLSIFFFHCWCVKHFVLQL